MKILLFLVAAISVVAGQQPHPCETPPQWEGKMQQISRYRSQPGTVLNAAVSYDYTNKRVRVREFAEDGSLEDLYDVLYLYNVGKQYNVTLKTNECTQSALTGPFIEFGIPKDARFVGTANVGPVNNPDEHAVIISFEGETKDEGARYFGDVTSPDCIPVVNGYYSDRTGFVLSQFFDVTGGIPDPMVFIPPSDCTLVPE